MSSMRILILLVALIGAVVLTYAPASAAREVEAERRPYFCAIFLLCLAGLLGIAITGDVFNVLRLYGDLVAFGVWVD